MREKYETLSAAALRELAKARGLKGLSGLRKEQLIERMLMEDERIAAEEKAEKEAAPAITEVKPVKESNPSYSSGYARESDGRNYSVRTNDNRNTDYRSSDNRSSDSRGDYRNGDNRTGDYRSSDYRNSDYRSNDYRNNDARSYDNRNGGDNRQENRGYRSRDNRTYTAGGNRMQQGGRTYSYAPRAQETPARQQEAPAVRQQEQQDANYRYQEQQRELERAAERAAEMREADAELNTVKEDLASLDSGIVVSGILEVMNDGFGFIRSANYMPGDNDVYVSPSQIRRFSLRTGDIITGSTRVKTEREKFCALLYVNSVNGYHPTEASRRVPFEKMTPIFPDKRLHLERPGASVAMRVVDVVSPIGKGQRGMIVSQPKAGKTTLLKEIAKSVIANNPEMHVIILLIDERPEEVTDIREAIEGEQVEVIYSTFDELPEHHKRVSEMTIERAKRLVEHKQDVMILLDSITRLARAYNLTVPPSGRTLSGGLDPAALHMPKRFFGAARNMREGGSLTILATALVDTGSKMDDVVFEEFKGTGNMELVLDRKLSEKRIFPAIDIVKSGTRREDLLLDNDEQIAVDNMRRAFNGMRTDEAVENILNIFAHTKNNREFIAEVKKNRIL